MKRWEIVRTVDDGEPEVLEHSLRRWYAARLLRSYREAHDGWVELGGRLPGGYVGPRVGYAMRLES